MELKTQLQGYLDSINPHTRLTYSSYAERMIANYHSKPITREQWDIIADLLGNRKMTDTTTERQWLDNVRTSFENLS